MPHITRLAVEERGDALQLDAATRRNLEIDASLSGQDSATLFTLIDSTVTPMGSRQLRRWLNRPLTDQLELRRRYQALALLVDARRFEGVREPLRAIGDVERILARVALRSARPRDLTALRASIVAAARTARHAEAHRGAADQRAGGRRWPTTRTSPNCCNARSPRNPRCSCAKAMSSRPATTTSSIELRRIATHTDEFLLELERRERDRSGIPSLKLAYNRVSGFYIEVSRSQADNVPRDYIRRQTVKNAERFITPELKSFEDKVLGVA